jgi:predicted nucleic acid-binding protein
MNAALLDTGVIVALLDRSERYHERCLAVLDDLPESLVTCEAVIAEACYLLRTVAGAAEAVIGNVASGVFHIPIRLADQAPAVEKLLRRYRDVPIDLADACLIDLADQLGTGRILTLDRDFEVYRWRSRKRFDLLLDL